jgi:hypothetical protein
MRDEEKVVKQKGSVLCIYLSLVLMKFILFYLSINKQTLRCSEVDSRRSLVTNKAKWLKRKGYVIVWLVSGRCLIFLFFDKLLSLNSDMYLVRKHIVYFRLQRVVYSFMKWFWEQILCNLRISEMLKAKFLRASVSALNAICYFNLCSLWFSLSGGDIFYGSRAPCNNEGEEVALNTNLDTKCFRCICQVSLPRASLVLLTFQRAVFIQNPFLVKIFDWEKISCSSIVVGSVSYIKR